MKLLFKKWGESTQKRGLLEFIQDEENLINFFSKMHNEDFFPEILDNEVKFINDQNGNEIYTSKYPNHIDLGDYEYYLDDIENGLTKEQVKAIQRDAYEPDEILKQVSKRY